MGRPRKDDKMKPKRREISVTDADWKRIKAEAKQAGLSASRYLLSQPKSRAVPAEVTIRQLEAITDIRDQMIRVAQHLLDNGAPSAAALLPQMIAIERQLDALIRQAGRS